MKKMILNGKETPVFKVNLHSHSTTSDGMHDPAELCCLYSLGGYDAIALTDHRKTNKVSELRTTLKEKFDCDITLISGIELHPMGPRNIPWHILVLGVPEDFPGEYATGFEAAQAARNAGALLYAAHPYWCGLTSADIAELGEITGTEVYNSSCRHIGKEYNMNTWDELLDAGNRPGWALAVDDCHSPATFGMGWTMIAAKENTPDALLDALRKGEFYSTEGPEFSRIEVKDGRFIAEFSPAVSAVLVSNRSTGYCETVPRWPLPGSEKGPVTSIDVDLSRFSNSSYIRCQIKDPNGKMAWSMPYFFSREKK
ncbi:MAG: PHP domain-containing protein [Lentisphaerae bacterium]|nr:PHP domain-containing protein [Lentisphaerota bacterium]